MPHGLKKILTESHELQITGVPEGFDAWLIADIARIRGSCEGPVSVLHIARDDAHMAVLADALSFFAPDITVLSFPAWDCLPYDRISPNATLSAARMDGLAKLVRGPASKGPSVLLTTVNATVQRVPARAAIEGATFSVSVGKDMDVDGLTLFLSNNGYTRTGTVMEPGEFATRGGIIDIYAPDSDQPLRLDLFGDSLESIRAFDPLSQRTTARRQRVELVPVGEVLLNKQSIQRFRTGYVAEFGPAKGDDQLYEAISAGRMHQGMEHWLPLFHERLESIFDYVPGATITLDHLAEEAVKERWATVEDHFGARQAIKDTSYGGAPGYRPLPPHRLYLDHQEWRQAIDGRPMRSFSPYKAPEHGDFVEAHGRKGRNFAPERTRRDINVFDALGNHLSELKSLGKRSAIACYSRGSRDRLLTVLGDHGIPDLTVCRNWREVEAQPAQAAALIVLRIEDGFETDGFAIITEQDILGDRLIRKPRRRARAEKFISGVSALSAGDLVVHVDHGIGRFEGLQTIDVSGQPHDCAKLVYHAGDRLFLPIENIDVLSRYGAADNQVQLDRLGGSGWQIRKAKLKQRIRDMADKLIELAAKREMKSAPRLTPPAGLYDEFCARFPFHETEDQQRSINDVVGDLASGRPMDRLICGDVGFGKTEVALRSAFIAAFSGCQVAVVTPTTLLCRQHYNTFRERFAGLPVRIEQLSRLVSAKEAANTKSGLADGQVDIVIGTHALLAKSLHMNRLGLLIIDEEQHFGVKHKETLKQMRANVHVLTLTATPIPRTLQMAMSGVRGLSLIATPPVDRLAVRSFVMPFDPVVVREALLRELYRGGQSFYVCPRVSDLGEAERFLKEQVPEVKVVVAHGQMPARQLEDVMYAFYSGQYDVLLATTIIESGLDIPTANTMIVHRADMFGLAQLYQLRGRIGRSKIRAYSYFTVPGNRALTKDADKRLKVLQSLDSLGAGFSLASHDLDIRGAGNLLGEEQSGHIREVGFELYQEMLETAVAQARTGGDGDGLDEEASWTPNINLGTPVLIPDSYVADLDARMGLYRRIASLEDQNAIDGFAAELIDRFGPLPDAVDHLLRIVAIKKLCRDASVEKLDAGPRGATIAFRDNSFSNPQGLVEFLSRQSGTAKLRPDHTLVYLRNWEKEADRLSGAHYLLSKLAEISA
ncbi:MAG: transcription-repair coupling factor [Sphingomonadales bacterium]